MSMSTILESGTMVYVGHLTASRDADGKTRDASAPCSPAISACTSTLPRLSAWQTA